jgi:hypothetical protein
MATAGPLSTSTWINETSAGEQAWNNPTLASASDDQYVGLATALTASGGASPTTQLLRGSGFGFTIPSGATIDGIEIAVERKASNASRATDHTIQLAQGAVLGGTNLADLVTTYPTTDTVKTYGGATELWGRSWTPSDINASNFGVGIRARNVSGSNTVTPRIDYVTVTVYYTPSSAVGADLTGEVAGAALADATRLIAPHALTGTGSGVSGQASSLSGRLLSSFVGPESFTVAGSGAAALSGTVSGTSMATATGVRIYSNWSNVASAETYSLALEGAINGISGTSAALAVLTGRILSSYAGPESFNATAPDTIVLTGSSSGAGVASVTTIRLITQLLTGSVSGVGATESILTFLAPVFDPPFGDGPVDTRRGGSLVRVTRGDD